MATSAFLKQTLRSFSTSGKTGVRALTPACGAIVTDCNLSDMLKCSEKSAKLAMDFHEGLMKHSVLFLQGQHSLTDEDIIKFG